MLQASWLGNMIKGTSKRIYFKVLEWKLIQGSSRRICSRILAKGYASGHWQDYMFQGTSMGT